MLIGVKFKKTTAFITAVVMFTTFMLGSMPMVIQTASAAGTGGEKTYTIMYKAEVENSSGNKSTATGTVTVSDKYAYHSVSNQASRFVRVLELTDTDTQHTVADNGTGDNDDRWGIIRTDDVMAVVEDGVLYLKPSTYRTNSQIDYFKYNVRGKGTAQPIFKVDYSISLTGTHPQSTPDADVKGKKVRTTEVNLIGKRTTTHTIKLPEGYIIDMSRSGTIAKEFCENSDGYNEDASNPKAKGYEEKTEATISLLGNTCLQGKEIRYSGFDSSLGGYTQLFVSHTISNNVLQAQHAESTFTIYTCQSASGVTLCDSNGTANYESKGSFIVKANTTMGAAICDISELAQYDPEMVLELGDIAEGKKSEYPLNVGKYFETFTSKEGWKDNEFKYLLNLNIARASKSEEQGNYVAEDDGIALSVEREYSKLIPNVNGHVLFDRIESTNVFGTDFNFILREEVYQTDADGNVKVGSDGKPAEKGRTAHLTVNVIQREEQAIKEPAHTFVYDYDPACVIGRTPVNLNIYELIGGGAFWRDYIDFLSDRSSDAEYILESITVKAMANGAEIEAEIRDNSLLDLDEGIGVIDIGGLTMCVYTKDVTKNNTTKRIGVANACTVNFIPKAKITSINDEANAGQLVHTKSATVARVTGEAKPSEPAYIANEHNLKSNLQKDAVIFDVSPDMGGSGYTGKLRDGATGAQVRLIDSDNPNNVEFMLNQGDNKLKSGVHKLYYKVRQDVGPDQFWSPDAIGMLRVNQPPIVYITDVEGAGYVKGEKRVIDGYTFNSEVSPFYGTNASQTVTIKADALSVDGDAIKSRHWFMYDYKKEDLDDGEGGTFSVWIIDTSNPKEVTLENKAQLNVESYDDNELKVKFKDIGCYAVGYVATDEFDETSAVEIIEFRVTKEPVLLIHGYLSSTAQLKKLGDKLTDDGYDVGYVDLKRASVLGISAGVNLIDLLEKNGYEKITVANVWKKLAQEGIPNFLGTLPKIKDIDPKSGELTTKQKTNYAIEYTSALIKPVITSISFNGRTLASFVGTELDTIVGKKYHEYFADAQQAKLDKMSDRIDQKYVYFRAQLLSGVLPDGKTTIRGIIDTISNEADLLGTNPIPGVNGGAELGKKRIAYLSNLERLVKDIRFDNDVTDLATPVMSSEHFVQDAYLSDINKATVAFAKEVGGVMDTAAYNRFIANLQEIYGRRREAYRKAFGEVLDEMYLAEKHAELSKIDPHYRYTKEQRTEKFLDAVWDEIFQYTKKSDPTIDPVGVGMHRLSLRTIMTQLNSVYRDLAYQDLWNTKKIFDKTLTLKDIDIAKDISVPNPISKLIGNDTKGKIIIFVLGKIFGGIELELLTIPLRFPIQPKIKIGDSLLTIAGTIGVDLKLKNLNFRSSDMTITLAANLNYKLIDIYWDMTKEAYNDYRKRVDTPIGEPGQPGLHIENKLPNYSLSDVHFASLNDGSIVRGMSPIVSAAEGEKKDELNTKPGDMVLTVAVKLIDYLVNRRPWAIWVDAFDKKAKEEIIDKKDEDAEEKRIFTFEAMAGIAGQGVEVSFIGARVGLYANLPFLKFANAPVASYIREVDKAVNDIRARTQPEGKITIIGKDMGGLVARHYAQTNGGAKVKKLILIATPNFGFSWAKYGPATINLATEAIKYFAKGFEWVGMVIDIASDIILGSAIHDMAPHSRFLSLLNGNNACEDSKLEEREVPRKDYTINNIYGTSCIATVSHKHFNLGPLGELVTPWLAKGDWIVAASASAAKNMINHEVKASFGNIQRSDEVMDIISHILLGDDHYKEAKTVAFEDTDIYFASGDNNCMGMLVAASGQEFTGSPYQENVIVQPDSGNNGNIRKGGSRTEYYKVDSSMNGLVITQNWSSGNTELTVVAPDGRKVGGAEQATFAGASYNRHNDINTIQILIDNPQPGNWKIVTTGTEKPVYGDTIMYGITAGYTTNMSVAVGTNKTMYKPNEPIAINVYAFNNAGRGSVTATLDAKIIKPSGIEERIEVFDDGRHNDGAAGDGIFGAEYTDTKLKGTYTLNVTAKFPNGANECIRQASIGFSVDALSNLAVFSDEITFERNGKAIAADNLDQNGSVYIKSAVKNQGDADIKGATVNFYEGKPGQTASKLIASDKVSVAANNSAVARVRWIPKYETKEIYVEIDTINLPLQKDYNNKLASKTIKVKKLDVPKFAMKDMVVLKGMPVTFNASSTKIDIPNATYEWNLDADNQGGIVGESAIKEGKIVVLLNGYSNTDKPYKVELTVKNGQTIIGKAKINVVVRESFDKKTAIADAGRDIFVRVGEDVHFDGTRSWSQFSVTMYTWDIDAADGNGDVDLIGATPVLIGGYSKPGKYVVTLTINDSIGSGPLTDEVIVHVLEPQVKIGRRTFKMGEYMAMNELGVTVNEGEKMTIDVTVENAPVGVTLYTFGQPYFIDFEDRGSGRGTITINGVKRDELPAGQTNPSFELVASDSRGNSVSIMINISINWASGSGVIQIER